MRVCCTWASHLVATSKTMGKILGLKTMISALCLRIFFADGGSDGSRRVERSN